MSQWMTYMPARGDLQRRTCEWPHLCQPEMPTRSRLWSDRFCCRPFMLGLAAEREGAPRGTEGHQGAPRGSVASHTTAEPSLCFPRIQYIVYAHQLIQLTRVESSCEANSYQLDSRQGHVMVRPFLRPKEPRSATDLALAASAALTGLAGRTKFSTQGPIAWRFLPEELAYHVVEKKFSSFFFFFLFPVAVD